MDLVTITELEKQGDKQRIEIFKDKGKWIYFDSNKERTNDMKLARYQQWKNDHDSN